MRGIKYNGNNGIIIIMAKQNKIVEIINKNNLFIQVIIY